jgi:hypothetical protein
MVWGCLNALPMRGAWEAIDHTARHQLSTPDETMAAEEVCILVSEEHPDWQMQCTP